MTIYKRKLMLPLAGSFAENTLLFALLTGCSGGSGNNSSGSPSGSPTTVQSGLLAPGPAAPQNAYVGTIPSGGVTAMTIDHATNFFRIDELNTFGASPTLQPIVGDFAAKRNFLGLHITNAVTSLTPVTLEIPGRGALQMLSPAQPPMIYAQNSGCLNFAGTVQFQLIPVGENPSSPLGYGRISVSTSQAPSTLSSTWTFSDYDLIGFDGSDQKPTALGTGICAQSAEGFATTIPEQVNGLPVVSTAAIGASGLFILDRDISGGRSPLVGMPVPSAPLDTVALASATYLGFESDANNRSPQRNGSLTLPVQFAGVGAGSTSLVGGDYPAGDVTQIPGSDLSFDLGKQDASHNGLYTAASATLPDPHQSCVGQKHGAIDASGNPVCVFPAVAVATLLEGKHVLFLNVQNLTGANFTIQFLLYEK